MAVVPIELTEGAGTDHRLLVGHRFGLFEACLLNRLDDLDGQTSGCPTIQVNAVDLIRVSRGEHRILDKLQQWVGDCPLATYADWALLQYAKVHRLLRRDQLEIVSYAGVSLGVDRRFCRPGGSRMGEWRDCFPSGVTGIDQTDPSVGG